MITLVSAHKKLFQVHDDQDLQTENCYDRKSRDSNSLQKNWRILDSPLKQKENSKDKKFTVNKFIHHKLEEHRKIEINKFCLT